jgi:hypothetical protein
VCVLGGLRWIFFFEIGTVAFEGQAELTDKFFHVVTDGLALLAGFCEHSLGVFLVLLG